MRSIFESFYFAGHNILVICLKRVYEIFCKVKCLCMLFEKMFTVYLRRETCAFFLTKVTILQYLL